MSNRYVSLFVSLMIPAVLTACSPDLRPDSHPAGTKVTLTMRMVSPAPFQLGPRSSQLFLDILTNQPERSEISQMPAFPMGKFTAGDTEYLWHGNGVIRGKGRSERLWHGSYLERLIAVVMREEHGSREAMQRILDTLEHDSTVASTLLQGPGQYPGGANDALHPARLSGGDTNGWRAFTSETNKP